MLRDLRILNVWFFVWTDSSVQYADQVIFRLTERLAFTCRDDIWNTEEPFSNFVPNHLEITSNQEISVKVEGTVCPVRHGTLSFATKTMSYSAVICLKLHIYTAIPPPNIFTPIEASTPPSPNSTKRQKDSMGQCCLREHWLSAVWWLWCNDQCYRSGVFEDVQGRLSYMWATYI